ncbi:MAG: 5'/3'-nucleotidase SurE [Gammaproteobacteria bacterium]|nr:5'/3'-nucleotidase SurE [Gammaproteobacteria bacterium]
MRILVTNDDGIDAPGIQELAPQIEDAGYEVVVVAPDHNASGTGASLGGLGPGNPVRVSKRRIDGLRSKGYALSGPPALCVMAGNLEAFGPRPDAVVSGINAGLNTGRSALHSGTVGGALAGQNFGYRSMAVSLDKDRERDRWHWETAAEIAVTLLPHVLEGPSRLALGLNVPGVPREQVRGIRWTRLATFGSVRAALANAEEDRLHFELQRTGYVPEAGTDLAAVRAGYAAITSLQGAVEVWGSEGQVGDPFDPRQGLPGASAGDELRPAQAVFDGR